MSILVILPALPPHAPPAVRTSLRMHIYPLACCTSYCQLHEFIDRYTPRAPWPYPCGAGRPSARMRVYAHPFLLPAPQQAQLRAYNACGQTAITVMGSSPSVTARGLPGADPVRTNPYAPTSRGGLATRSITQCRPLATSLCLPRQLSHTLHTPRPGFDPRRSQRHGDDQAEQPDPHCPTDTRDGRVVAQAGYQQEEQRCSNGSRQVQQGAATCDSSFDVFVLHAL